jgi:hypothetical protein
MSTVLLFVLAQATGSHLVWKGIIRAEVVGTQPGAQHRTSTVIDLRLHPEAGAGRLIRLRSRASRYRADIEVQGQAACIGTADETLTEQHARSTLLPEGRYEIVLERGFFGWACGKNVSANGARDVTIGTGIDPEPRRLRADGRSMRGSYATIRRTADSEYLFNVMWDIERQE